MNPIPTRKGQSGTIFLAFPTQLVLNLGVMPWHPEASPEPCGESTQPTPVRWRALV
jgi:hypothetical protein